MLRGRDPLSRAIEWITHSRYNHVAIYIGDGQVYEAERWHRANASPLSQYNGIYDVYTVPTLTDEQRAIIVQKAKSMSGIRYDYLDIARLFLRYVFGLNLAVDDPMRIICSELIFDAYLAASIRLVDRAPYDISPEDLVESPLLIRKGS